MNATVLNNLLKIKDVNRSNIRSLHVGILVEDPGPGTPDQYNFSDVKSFVDAFASRGYRTTLLEFVNPMQVFERIVNERIDIIFNMCEVMNKSNLYEPHIVATLEIMGVPYTGSDYSTLETCLDKIKMKKILNFHNLPTAKWDYTDSLDKKINKSLEFPLIVKPAKQDGSIGINCRSVVRDEKELYTQVAYILDKFGGTVLIEEFLTGDEYDVCILGNYNSEIKMFKICKYYFKDLPFDAWPFFPYEMKWENHPIYNYDKVVCEQPAKNMDKKLEEIITRNALDIYKIFECKGYGRVEMRIDRNGEPAVIEVNPNTAMDLDNNFVRVAEKAGTSYGDLLEEILWLGIENFKNKNNL